VAVNLQFTLFETALGACALVWSPNGLVGLALPGATPQDTLAYVNRRFAALEATVIPSSVEEIIALVRKHLAGNPQDFSGVKLDLSGAPEFHRRVFTAIRAIPAGEVRTYGEIAKAINAPLAARAVGQALGRNPIALIVPCHRVVGAGKNPGGFSAEGGVSTKARILRAEGFTLPQVPLSPKTP
jgi:methylated-DNA-[protein]-cysteine S-methyltransferase